MDGYNYTLVNKIKSIVKVPLSVLGGAGSLDDIKRLVNENGVIGAAAGSIFVFKGPYKAVLINYPDSKDKELLLQDFLNCTAP